MCLRGHCLPHQCRGSHQALGDMHSVGQPSWVVPHDETVETHDAVRGVEGRHALTFFAHRYGPEGIHPVDLQIILLAVELFDFVRCKWDGAGNSLEALIHQRIDGDTKAMVGVGFELPGGELGNDDQARDI